MAKQTSGTIDSIPDDLESSLPYWNFDPVNDIDDWIKLYKLTKTFPETFGEVYERAQREIQFRRLLEEKDGGE